MGHRSRNSCSTCSYTCVVNGSGDIDYGMASAAITLRCNDCHEIADASVHVPDDRMFNLTRADLVVLPPCACCGSAAVTVWREGDACPHCGGSMIADTSACELWD